MADADDTGPRHVQLNEATRVVRLSELGRPRPALDPRAAFLVAHERLAVLASAASEPAIAVVALDSEARVIGSQLLRDRGSLIVGRHSMCDLRLSGDTVSLRHLALFARAESGTLQVHGRDLASGRAFATEDGQSNRAVVAEGPLYLGVEGYALWLVPTGDLSGTAGARAHAADAYEALPARRFCDRRAADEAAADREPPPIVVPHRFDALSRVTRVTSLGPPLLLGEGDEPEVGWGVLRFEDGPHRERRTVTAERLERGVLLGRYARCGVVVGDGDSSVSRVHALVMRIGAEVWIVDTASTNGIWRDGERVSADVLRDRDTLTLSSSVTLDWRRTEHPEA